VDKLNILIIGAGIGGLTAGIALGRRGHRVDIVEKEATGAVYGVGIIQQSNVVRAMHSLGILQDYLGSGFGFDHVDVFSPGGQHLASVPSHKLVQDCPANVGISRIALHDILQRRAREAGASIRFGLTVTDLRDDATGVGVSFTDGTEARYDIVIGADGLHSAVRQWLFADAPQPQFTGQGVWRYNFKRPAEVVSLHAYAGPIGMGLVPLSDELMYLYITTPEPGNPRYATAGLAAAMRDKLKHAPPVIATLAAQITDDAAVVYRPLAWLLLQRAWHKGRIVLLGDAVHATTPHLGQGAGMAIEDAIVLAEELSLAGNPEQAFTVYRNRRFERCRYIVEHSKAIGDSQLGLLPPVDQAKATADMFRVVAEPL